MRISDRQLLFGCCLVILIYTSFFAVAIYNRNKQDDKKRLNSN